MVCPSAVQLEPVASGFVPRQSHSVDSDEPGTTWPSITELRTGQGLYTTAVAKSSASADAETKGMPLTRLAHNSRAGRRAKAVVRVNAATPSKAPTTPTRRQPGWAGKATHAH